MAGADVGASMAANLIAGNLGPRPMLPPADGRLERAHSAVGGLLADPTEEKKVTFLALL